MSNTITFQLNHWCYNIKIGQDEFALYLEKEIESDFKDKIAINPKKILLEAYINAKYELFSQNQQLEVINEALKKKI